MTTIFTVTRSNFHLPRLSMSYAHRSDLDLSPADLSTKQACLEFFKKPHSIINPRLRCLLEKNILILSPHEIDVILGVINLIKRSAKTQVNTSQRFEIEGLCSITFFKKEEKTFVIHQPNNHPKQCERRGLKFKYALKIHKQDVLYIRENTELLSWNAPQPTAINSDEKIEYVYRPGNKKARYIKKCTLTPVDYDITTAQLFQWRSSFKELSTASEWKIFCIAAKTLFTPHGPSSPSGIFKTKDLLLKFDPVPDDFLPADLEGKSLEKREKTFPINLLASTFFSKQSTEKDKGHVYDDFMRTANKISSLAALIKKAIIQSPNFNFIDQKEQDSVLSFYESMNELAEKLELMSEEQEDSIDDSQKDLLFLESIYDKFKSINSKKPVTIDTIKEFSLITTNLLELDSLSDSLEALSI